MTHLTEKHLRKLVEAKTGPIESTIWKFMREDGYIDDALGDSFEAGRDDERVRFLVDIAKAWASRLPRLRETGPRLPKPQPRKFRELAQPKETPPNTQAAAFSKIIALLLDKEETIRQFRLDVLGNKLLLPEEILPWVRSIVENEGTDEIVTLRFPLPAGAAIAAKNGLDELDPRAHLQSLVHAATEHLSAAQRDGTCGIGFETSFLSVPAPNQEYAEVILINSRGVLARLHRLAAQYNAFWTEAAAVCYILTGRYSSARRATARYGTSGGSIPWVSLRVHPSLSGDEVRSLYLQARAGLDGWPGVTSAKGLTARHLALAVFAVEQSGSWSYRLEKWNKTYPQWVYPATARSTFARDCRAAYKRLTGWPWKDEQPALKKQRPAGRLNAKK